MCIWRRHTSRSLPPTPHSGYYHRSITMVEKAAAAAAAEETVTIRAGGTAIVLPKALAISRSGYMRKRVGGGERQSVYDIPCLPGGARGVEAAAKLFTSSEEREMEMTNIALVCCVAEYMEMEAAAGRAEQYLREKVLTTLQGSISTLHQAEKLLPAAEKAGLVGRCVDAIARIASSGSLPPPPARWWAEALTTLRVDTFRRVVLAMRSRGFDRRALLTIVMLYAQKSLRGLVRSHLSIYQSLFDDEQSSFPVKEVKLDAKEEHERRVVLETTVGVLADETSGTPVSFLSLLLRSAVRLDATVACRLDLERRIGLQLGKASLDDLWVPCPFSFSGDTVYDVDAVRRMLSHYLQHEEDAGGTPNEAEKVAWLMESFLAEIAPDSNLAAGKFLALAELIPKKRATEDGMYRAIDIYLKAHPSMTDAERKKICSVMDCQRLSKEARAHAAQNVRLPLQVAIQVMYLQQKNICEEEEEEGGGGGGESPPAQKKLLYSPQLNPSQDEELLRLRRENDDLRLELGKMKTKMGAAPPGKPPIQPRRSILDSMSKTFGRLNPFPRSASRTSPSFHGTNARKDRRHSIS